MHQEMGSPPALPLKRVVRGAAAPGKNSAYSLNITINSRNNKDGGFVYTGANQGTPSLRRLEFSCTLGCCAPQPLCSLGAAPPGLLLIAPLLIGL